MKQKLTKLKGKMSISELIQCERENLKNPVTIQEIEFLSLKLLKKNPTGQDSFTEKFYQIFKEELMLILHNLFQEIGGTPNSLYEVHTVFISEQDKNSIIKNETKNYRPKIPHAKILNKILVSRI